jgi:5-methylthioribose kinase
MSVEPFLITHENLPAYLVRRGLVSGDEGVMVRELGGGVSNIVLLAEWPRDPQRRWVVKQSLEKLRVKDDWRSERERIFREAESIQALRPVLGEAALPRVIHIDRGNFLFVMTAAPAGSLVWKDMLLGRRADGHVAREAGLLLARMINGSRHNRVLESRFSDRRVFEQLRLDPYYRTTASRHPELGREFENLIETSLGIRVSLVHGDYSPKNLLVRGSRIFLIDFEVIHWGDPAFDAAFLLNHLFLKAFHLPQIDRDFMELIREFWNVLTEALGSVDFGTLGRSGFEAWAMTHLGGLMLARIDGKSPVEYIQDEETKARVRRAAHRILVDHPQELEDVIGIVLGEIHGGH